MNKSTVSRFINLTLFGNVPTEALVKFIPFISEGSIVAEQESKYIVIIGKEEEFHKLLKSFGASSYEIQKRIYDREDRGWAKLTIALYEVGL